MSVYARGMGNHSAYRQIGIIGTGRVARAIGLGLSRHSAEPIRLWGRDTEKRDAAVALIGHARSTGDLAEIALVCDLIVIAVSDDAIGPIVADLAHMPMTDHSRLIFHVSGRSGVAVLDPLRMPNTMVAAIHPAMTFTGHAQAEVRRMAGARFAVTGGNDEAGMAAGAIVRLLGGVSIEIIEDHRALYHAALCHAANHLVTLIAGSAHALTAAGVDDPWAMLAPLVRAALDNSLKQGFDALSGPLLRGDRETIGNHIAALAQDAPGVLPAYRAMAVATLDQLDRGEGDATDRSGLRSDIG